jgi:hypothetical protein
MLVSDSEPKVRLCARFIATSDRGSVFTSKLCSDVTRLQQFYKIRVGDPSLPSRNGHDPL